MTHGFDDSGAQFDGDGNLTDWWTAEDKTNFEKATKAWLHNMINMNQQKMSM
jgi:putative endopeptidase